MGVVYLAEDTELMRKVAIKFLPRQIAGDLHERKRFEIEVEALKIIETASEQHNIEFLHIKSTILVDSLAEYPSFQKIMKDINFPTARYTF